MASKGVPGVVLVFIDEDGNAIAHAADFNSTGYGGFTLQEAQRIRTKRKLAINVCNAYSSPQFTRGIQDYDAEQIMQRLIDKHGCHVHEINIHATEGQ